MHSFQLSLSKVSRFAFCKKPKDFFSDDNFTTPTPKLTFAANWRLHWKTCYVRTYIESLMCIPQVIYANSKQYIVNIFGFTFFFNNVILNWQSPINSLTDRKQLAILNILKTFLLNTLFNREWVYLNQWIWRFLTKECGLGLWNRKFAHFILELSLTMFLFSVAITYSNHNLVSKLSLQKKNNPIGPEQCFWSQEIIFRSCISLCTFLSLIMSSKNAWYRNRAIIDIDEKITFIQIRRMRVKPLKSLCT